MTSASDTRQLSPAAELILAGSWLTCVVAMALPATLWWGNQHAGSIGMLASLLAAGLCWVSSVIALVVRTRFPDPQDAFSGTLGTVLVRMVMILGGAMLVMNTSQELVKAAFLGQVVIYFFLTLTVETLLAVRWVKNLETSAVNVPREESQVPESSVKAV